MKKLIAALMSLCLIFCAAAAFAANTDPHKINWSDYEAQERFLRAELNAKLQNLQYERNKKLLDVARRQDEFRINYLQWKKEQQAAEHERRIIQEYD